MHSRQLPAKAGNCGYAGRWRSLKMKKENMRKELIKQWGESSAYCAKSHFKTADMKRIWIKILVTVNVLFAIFSILELGMPILTKLLAVISLVASILILVFESQNEKNSIRRHMVTGDDYLKVHYELQELFYSPKIEEDEFQRVAKKMKKLTDKDKPIISQLAKFWAKYSIEKKKEMIIWWK